jgi:hypothetical protein
VENFFVPKVIHTPLWKTLWKSPFAPEAQLVAGSNTFAFARNPPLRGKKFSTGFSTGLWKTPAKPQSADFAEVKA